LARRQLGEEAEEAADIGILGIAPELPVVEDRQAVLVEPDTTLRRLAHLGTRGCRDERRRQAEEGAAVDAAPELDAADDIAPLIGAAHLQDAVVAPGQLEKIVSLEDHVVEFEEGERLLALESQAHAVLG